MKDNSDHGAKSITLVVALNILMCLSTLPALGQQTDGQTLTADDHIQIRDALRRGGYREAARVRGHYVGDYDPHWDLALFDVEYLTKNSVVVVVGVATKALPSRLEAEGQLILTDYEISVRETIKGIVSDGKIKVSVPGGKMEFEDGTSAEMRTPQFEQLKVSQTYTLFLMQYQTEPPDVFALTGGPQGVVEIAADGASVKSYGRPTDPVFKEVKELDAESFRRLVRTQAKKWPQPGKCCS